MSCLEAHFGFTCWVLNEFNMQPMIHKLLVTTAIMPQLRAENYTRMGRTKGHDHIGAR
jgi:hypothetical protein